MNDNNVGDMTPVVSEVVSTVPMATEDRKAMLEAQIQAVKDRRNLIIKLMKEVLTEEVDYGTIPGTNKPTLYLAGAQKLGVLWNVRLKDAQIQLRELEGDHREYIIKSILETPDGKISVGVGSCSTKESKYRWRTAKLKCPECGASALIRGRDFNTKKPTNEMICWSKKGGCGAKFDLEDPRIKNQPRGKVENPDIADIYNTALKIAKKRSYVDGIITLFGASDAVTQDVEDLPPEALGIETPPQPQQQREDQVEEAPAKEKLYIYDFAKAPKDKWAAIGIYMAEKGAVVPKNSPTDLVWVSKVPLKKVAKYLIETRDV